MISVDNLTLIGEFAVDSGQAMVGDPCYLDARVNRMGPGSVDT